SHFHLGQWEECRRAIQDAFRCGEDVSNPFLRLRLGQAPFELGGVAEAANWLTQGYPGKGLRPFKGEDPEELETFRGQREPPAGRLARGVVSVASNRAAFGSKGQHSAGVPLGPVSGLLRERAADRINPAPGPTARPPFPSRHRDAHEATATHEDRPGNRPLL